MGSEISWTLNAFLFLLSLVLLVMAGKARLDDAVKVKVKLMPRHGL